jgi:hypothetical protein
MSEVSTLRLYMLRAMYLLMVVGLAVTEWPAIISPPDTVANVNTVLRSLLGALGLLAALGLRYPLKVLPVLLFEFVWKLIWVVAFALRMWLDTGLNQYATESFFACMMGVVLVPIVMPWRYFYHHYVRAPGDPWRRPSS